MEVLLELLLEHLESLFDLHLAFVAVSGPLLIDVEKPEMLCIGNQLGLTQIEEVDVVNEEPHLKDEVVAEEGVVNLLVTIQVLPGLDETHEQDLVLVLLLEGICDPIPDLLVVFDLPERLNQIFPQRILLLLGEVQIARDRVLVVFTDHFEELKLLFMVNREGVPVPGRRPAYRLYCLSHEDVEAILAEQVGELLGHWLISAHLRRVVHF